MYLICRNVCRLIVVQDSLKTHQWPLREPETRVERKMMSQQLGVKVVGGRLDARGGRVGGECPLVDSGEQQQGEWADACRMR